MPDHRQKCTHMILKDVHLIQHQLDQHKANHGQFTIEVARQELVLTETHVKLADILRSSGIGINQPGSCRCVRVCGCACVLQCAPPSFPAPPSFSRPCPHLRTHLCEFTYTRTSVHAHTHTTPAYTDTPVRNFNDTHGSTLQHTATHCNTLQHTRAPTYTDAPARTGLQPDAPHIQQGPPQTPSL